MSTAKTIGKLFDFTFKTAAKASKRRSRPFCSAILAAGGHSVRMGRDKLLMNLCGKPVIQHSIEAMVNCDAIDEIVIVCNKDIRAKVAAICEVNAYSKIKAIAAGGETRADSVAAGLACVSDSAQLIAIHDAARPLADSGFISAVISAAKGKPGVIPVVPVKDTIKIVENGVVASTPERSKLYAAQTPQVFDADIYKAAVAMAKGRTDITDDCMLLEAFGAVVTVVGGRESNIKLTTPEDAVMAELILSGGESV